MHTSASVARADGERVAERSAPKRVHVPPVLFTTVLRDKLQSPGHSPLSEIVNYDPAVHGRSLDFWMERAGDLYGNRTLRSGANRCRLLAIYGGTLDHALRFRRLVRFMPRLRTLRLCDVRGIDLASVLSREACPPELREVDLLNCVFRPETIAAALALAPTRLVTLSVINCALKPADVRALAAALLAPDCILYRLAIAEPLLRAEPHLRMVLCDAIARNRSVVDIDVTQGTPGDTHVVLQLLNECIELVHNRHLLVVRARERKLALMDFLGPGTPPELQAEYDRAQRRMAINRRRLWCVTAETVVLRMRSEPVPAFVDTDAYLDLLEMLMVPCTETFDANNGDTARAPWYMQGIPRNALGRWLPLFAESMPYSGRAAEATCLWLRHMPILCRVAPAQGPAC